MYSKVKIKILQPSGFFDGRQGRKIHEELSEIIASGAKIILIDFQSITFMDSSGFGTLLLTLKKIRQQEAKLALCSINDQIRMILDLTNTSKVFDVFPDQASFLQIVE